MKPFEQIGKARNARINQAVGHAERLLAILRALQGHRKDEHLEDKDAWFDSRTELESLTQCVHEANAYNNALASSANGRPSDFDSENAGSNPAEASKPNPSSQEQAAEAIQTLPRA